MPGLGLALGSGGARGWSHIGVLRALEASGARPAAVAGASMGALVGAAWAAGRLDALEAWARGLTAARFLSLLDPRPASGGLFAGREIGAVLSAMGVPERIEDLEVPFAAVATDMETGRAVVLDRGPLLPAVRASVSIPGVLAPHRLGGRWMLDGGLTDPVPVGPVRRLGAGRVIAVNPNAHSGGRLWTPPEGEPPWEKLALALPPVLAGRFRSLRSAAERSDRAPHFLDVASVSIDILTEQVRRMRLAEAPPDLLLAVELGAIGTMDFHRAAEAIAAGREAAEAASDRIAALAATPPP